MLTQLLPHSCPSQFLSNLVHPSKCSGQKLTHTRHHDSNTINTTVESPLLITAWFQVIIFSPGYHNGLLTGLPITTLVPSPCLLFTYYSHFDAVKAEVKPYHST